MNVFHLYYGNDLKALARRVGERLFESGDDPLESPVVLIPQPGMRRWLEIELAEARGIIANVNFRLPGEFIAQLLRANFPDLPHHSLFDREVLCWRLMPLLAELARQSVDTPLARYLAGDASQQKRLQLAHEFARALERYQAYRRDMLADWERGAEADDWQAEAWRRLVRDTDETSRARLIGDFLTRHAGGALRPQGLPPRLSVFGCVNISPDVLRVIGTLAGYCEVDFLLPTPCAEYWGDVRDVRKRLRRGGSPTEQSEQPLLESWGHVGREFLEQVFSYDEVQPAEEEALLRTPSRETLLGRVQADILELRVPAPDECPDVPDADDVSLRMHVCHSPLREMQILHDRLLDLFERDATLKPRDIAVMMPDVASYAPAVDAVFGSLSSMDARRIPYTIADRSARDEHPIVEVFLKLLSLPTSRWSASDLLDLIAVPAISRRLELEDGALESLQHWLDVAGIRWGLDATTREAFGAGSYRAFTWAEGIERLLLGYAGGDTQPLDDLSPVPALEGSNAETFGQALLVLRALEQLAAAQRSAHPAGTWQALYQDIIGKLMPERTDDRDERRALEAVRSTLAALAENARAGGCDEALEWQTVRAFLSERLGEAGAQQRFLAGGVSFCGMLPLRAIPFRVIALLGVDDAAFPRREPANGISRLEHALRHARKLGDRSVRDDDRYLFLQLVTSAADALHLSWVGHDARSGKAREPSALVAELLEVLTRDYFADGDAARRALVIEHPLQPFASRLFDDSNPALFSYRGEWRDAARGTPGNAKRPFFDGDGEQAGPQPESTRITLAELIDFWANPARAFLRDRLLLTRYADPDIAADDDPLILDSLQRHQLKQDIIESAFVDGAPIATNLDAVTRMRLQLPVGAAGVDEWQTQSAVAAGIARRMDDWRGVTQPLPAAQFEITLDDGSILDCTLQPVWTKGLLRFATGSLHGGHRVRAWIEYLALVAHTDREQAGLDVEPVCTLVGLDEDKCTTSETFRSVDPEQARAELTQLVAGYRDGQRAPLPFFAKSAWIYMATLAGVMGADSSVEAALKKAQSMYAGSSYEGGNPGERSDAWIELAFRDLEPFTDASLSAAFEKHATRVFGTAVGILYGAAL